MVFYLLLDVIIAYFLDLILGDPYWLPHPVRFIGSMVKLTEKVLRALMNYSKVKKYKSERFAGIILTVFVVSATFSIVMLILEVAKHISPIVFHVLNIYFIYTSIAARCLAEEAMKVYRSLRDKDISKARIQLSMLVGRETECLNESAITRGVVETTAENTVDGIISPLFYAFLGTIFGIGAPLAYAFKAISTLDSMVGYMNEKYINFGKFSAKTDDVFNYIPARLSGLLIPLAAIFCRKNFKTSFSIMLRDRRNHKSPNCAYPEAAVAGALGIQIGGNNIYFGEVVKKPTIGDRAKELEVADISDTVKLMYISELLTIALFTAVGAVFL